MHPLEDRLGLIVLGSALSTLGKYWICIGRHWNGRRNCWDVVAINRETGAIIKRHYNGLSEDKMNEAAALAFWEEFHERMTAKRGPSEEDEVDPITIIGPN